MSQKNKCWAPLLVLGLSGLAGALPALPAATLAEEAVRDALTAVVPAPARPAPVQAVQPPVRPAQAATTETATTQPTAAQVRSAQIARAQAQAAQQARTRAVEQAQAQQAQTVAVGRRTGRSVVARATAYNSTPGQTDSTPFITATGTRVRNGVVALSRDLLRTFPYGSKITIEDLSGRTGNLLRGQVFSVEDTMAARKVGSVDIWMASRTQAIRFGARQVRITAVR
ncbi:hypothetical protein V3W47_05450 [Deinococcus sp. YIM 134068]|uniref:hypothetical protein n=1 Tax=Deinococcus lichenicola TaxID=3118910 RepID=UPI002F929DB4